jgi:hypothetical protein
VVAHSGVDALVEVAAEGFVGGFDESGQAGASVRARDVVAAAIQADSGVLVALVDVYNRIRSSFDGEILKICTDAGESGR